MVLLVVVFSFVPPVPSIVKAGDIFHEGVLRGIMPLHIPLIAHVFWFPIDGLQMRFVSWKVSFGVDNTSVSLLVVVLVCGVLVREKVKPLDSPYFAQVFWGSPINVFGVQSYVFPCVFLGLV